MAEINLINKSEKILFYFTLPIVFLMAICSSIGIWNQNLYTRESLDWMSQCIGQDISNLFFVAPILLVSAFFIKKGNRIAKIIWSGTMITNIYSYVIYCFAVHFNVLFHLYCITFGLSIYSLIYFLIYHANEDFRHWYTEKVPTKITGIFLFIIAFLFVFLWLSQSLPEAITNTVPKSISNDGLLTNPIHALDFSFYLPLMFITSFMIIKKKNSGYLLAPMMIVFTVITNINIITLTFFTMEKTNINSMPLIIVFSVFTIICLGFLWLMLKNTSKYSYRKHKD